MKKRKLSARSFCRTDGEHEGEEGRKTGKERRSSLSFERICGQQRQPGGAERLSDLRRKLALENLLYSPVAGQTGGRARVLAGEEEEEGRRGKVAGFYLLSGIFFCKELTARSSQKKKLTARSTAAI
jgi:hypothetical protein